MCYATVAAPMENTALLTEHTQTHALLYYEINSDRVTGLKAPLFLKTFSSVTLIE